jgi:hypothetical protein
MAARAIHASPTVMVPLVPATKWILYPIWMRWRFTDGFCPSDDRFASRRIIGFRGPYGEGMRAISAVVAALVIGAGPVHADVSAPPVEIPGSAANLGIWRLAAYGDDRREFTHCAISANYTNGMTMTIAVSHGGTWYVEWAHLEWRLYPNERVEMAGYVDGAGPHLVSAKASTARSVLVELSTGSPFLEALRRGTSLTVVTRSAQHDLSLEGVYKALAEIVECARRGDGGPRSSPASALPTASRQPGRPRVAEEQTGRRVEATIILSNLLARRDLRDFRILSEREIRDLDAPELLHWHAVWRVDDLTGALRILAPEVAVSASELAATVIAQESRTCRGPLFSRTISNKASPHVVYLLAACEEGASGYDACYVIVPRARGGYYLSGMVARGKTGERKPSIVIIDTFLRALTDELRQ